MEKKEEKSKKIVNNPKQCSICGATISWFNKARHEKSKKHTDANYIQFMKFEMK